MKKFLSFFLLAAFLGSGLFAQTNIQIMKDEAFSNNLPSVIGEKLNRADGREAIRWFKFSDGELPYEVLANGADIKVKLSHKIPWTDDTTLSNTYRHTWKMYVIDKQKVRYQVGLGIVQLGDSNYVECDISLAAGLLQQDSVAIMYWMSTWAQNAVFVDMDLEISANTEKTAPYWLEKIADAAGVWHEKEEARWENPKMIIPDDTKDRTIFYLGSGTGEHGSNEVPVTFEVDKTQIYEFSPYVEDCEKYLPFNNAIEVYHKRYPDIVDTASYIAGRTGSCIGGIAEPIILTGDIFNNYLTPGFHSVRFEPQLQEVNLDEGWSDYSFASLMYGAMNESAGAASKFEVVAEALDFVAHERAIPVNLYLVNNVGPVSNASAKIQLSGEGLSFSTDLTKEKEWSNPLTFDQDGASRLVYVKGLAEGTYTMSVEDLNGALATSTMEITVYENLAHKITDKEGVADGSCNWNNEAPQHAIDGSLDTKWCNNDGVEPHYVKYGFDTPQEINYFILHHAYAGGESANYNTSDFKINVYNADTKAWENFVDVMDNEAAVSYHVKDASFTSVKCDSVELYITKSEQNGNVARVYEIEMFNNANPYTSVEEINNNTPLTFQLFQNYPNPFNPSTEIKFFTPNYSKVDIRIYNAIGQEVSRLISGEVASGTHKIHWNGTNGNGSKVAGGVYFYSVRYTDAEGNTKVQTRKMVLMP